MPGSFYTYYLEGILNFYLDLLEGHLMNLEMLAMVKGSLIKQRR
jgi:hypothetical protein